MQRFLGLVSLSTMFLSTMACGGGSDLVVLSLLEPEIEMDGSCLANPGGISLARGMLDVQATNARYAAAVAVGNMAEGDSKNDLIIDEADLSFTADHPELESDIEFALATVPIGVTVQADFDHGLWIELIPPQIAAVIANSSALTAATDRAVVSVTAQLVGRDGRGKSVESLPHTFPVEVCQGCLFCPDGSEPLAWGCSPGAPPTFCQP